MTPLTRVVWMLVCFMAALMPSIAHAGTLAGGSRFTVLVKPDGTVWTWGQNQEGQLGDGTTTNRTVPAPVPGLTNVVAVAAGGHFVLALKSDGTVWAWGQNSNGELGDGTNTRQTSPVQLSLTDIVAIAAGHNHSVALESDGTVWTWGYNGWGQFGVGNTTPSSTPVAATAFGTGAAIGAGFYHTLVVKTDGTVVGAGLNGNGQLGNNSTSNTSTPVTMSGITTGVAVAGGYEHSVVLLADGTVRAAGRNVYGELGNASQSQSTTPVTATGLSGITAIAAGWHTSSARKNDGTIWTWGYNGEGQVGDNSTTMRTAPTQATTSTGMTNASLLGEGHGHSVAVDTNGVVWTWGFNEHGAIGDGTQTTRLVPTAISEASYAFKVGAILFSVASGTYNSPRTVTILTATPSADIHYTTTGVDPTESDPTVVSGGSVVIDVTATLKARGWKADYAPSSITSATYTLQPVTPGFSPSPGTFTTPQNVTISTSTPNTTIHYTTDTTTPTESSSIYSGPIGVGTTTTLKAIAVRPNWTPSPVATGTFTMFFGTAPAPTFVTTPGTYTSAVDVTMSAIAGATIRYTTNGSTPTAASPAYAGPIPVTQTTTLTVRTFHPDYTASANTSGTFTIVVADPVFTPVSGAYPASQMVTIASPTAGATVTYTLNGATPTATDPAVPAGGLAIGTYTVKAKAWKTGLTPSNVATADYALDGSGLTMAAVAAGGYANGGHSLAVRPDGVVWAWGDNQYHAIGDGTNTRRRTPTIVAGLTGIRRISAGGSHNAALDGAGAVWTWGINVDGQIGDGTTTWRSLPVRVISVDAARVDAGYQHTVVARTDGTVQTWGSNSNGQLGDGTTTWRYTPTTVSGLTNVVEVAAGERHTLALKSDGTVWSWGQNSSGQLGNNGTQQQLSPVQVSGLTNVVAIDAGRSFSLALKSDGTVWSWGSNSEGQLGDGTNNQRLVAVQVPSIIDATRISAGWYHSLVLRQDQTVWTFGNNGNGELGDGSGVDQWSPVQVSTLSSITGIGAGPGHSLAVSSDGVIWAWGWNTTAEVGDGTEVKRTTPVAISDPNFTWKVAAPRFSHATGTHVGIQNVTVTSETPGAVIHYTVNGVAPTESDPTVVSGNTITVDTSLTLTARAWKSGMPPSLINVAVYTLKLPLAGLSHGGWGTYHTPQSVTVTSSVPGVTIRYRLDGGAPTESDPVVASGGTVLIDQGAALTTRVWKSGWMTSDHTFTPFFMNVGAIGLSPAAGTYTSATTVTLSTVTPGAQIHYTTNGVEPTTSDPFVASGGTVAITASSTLKARGVRTGWGSTSTAAGNYVLNLGTVAAPTLSPVGGTYATAQSVTITSATTGATIRYTTDGTEPTSSSPIYTAPIAVAIAQTIKAKAFKRDWQASGTSSADYVLTETTTARPMVSPGTGLIAAARYVSVTSLTPGATIHYTLNGIDPTETDPTVPGNGLVLIDRSLRLKAKAWKTGMDPSPVTIADYCLTGAIAAGEFHTLALKTDGTVWAWGKNSDGQLGNGSTTQSTTPVQVSGLTEVIAIAAGANHNFAIERDGSLWAWGRNAEGQLGDNSTTMRTTPVGITGVTNVVSVAAGRSHSLSATASGAVYVWGNNSYGQIGDGGFSPRLTPWLSPGLAGVTQVAAGEHHSIALRTDGTASGTLWLWGKNNLGQLGNGNGLDIRSPFVQASGITLVGGGIEHSLMLLGDGTMRASGSNNHGVVGDGSGREVIRWAPVDVLGTSDVVRLSTSGFHNLVLHRDGSVSSWGNDAYGQTSQTWPDNPWPFACCRQGRPSFVVGLPPVSIAVAAGYSHSVVATPDGSVWTWGLNGNGQLGDGTTTNLARPAKTPNFSLTPDTWISSDPDGDGLPTYLENEYGTDPLNADTNGDGLLDDAAVRSGQSATNLDMDGDGLTNVIERTRGLDPFRTDSDGDGVSDSTDAFPLDPTRTTGPSPDPNDHTPPVITLIEPTNARPVP